MGELLRQIKTERPNTGGRIHVVDRILSVLSDEDRADLLKALRDEKVSAAVIASVLTRNGHRVRSASVSQWRKTHGTR